MIALWKTREILKGVLTFAPPVNAWRVRRSPPDGADSPRYCYSVWLRHLVTLSSCGFSIRGASVGELGPGDSVGVGLAALLSGAARYTGLDLVPFAAKSNVQKIFDDLVAMYRIGEPIPDGEDFQTVRPLLDSYNFPRDLINFEGFEARVEAVKRELRSGINRGARIRYQAPWTSPDIVSFGSLDLIYSQAVLEHVDSLEDTYRTMFKWLKPGGHCSNVIDLDAHRVSPIWNGHWAYADWQWRLVRGQREFLLNREPFSTHLNLAKKIGFEILLMKQEYASEGLDTRALAKRFQSLDSEDAQTCGAILIMRKPVAKSKESVAK